MNQHFDLSMRDTVTTTVFRHLVIIICLAMPSQVHGKELELRANDRTGASASANPFTTDSDGDGISDGDEDDAGTDSRDANSFPAQAIQITKWSSGQSRTTAVAGSGSFMGFYRTGSWVSRSEDILINTPMVTPGFLDGLLATVGFPDLPPTSGLLEEFRKEILEKSDIYSTGTGVEDWPSDPGKIRGTLSSTRVWIKAALSTTEQKFHFVKVREKSTNIFATSTLTKETVSTELVEIVIPAGDTLSAPMDLKYLPTTASGAFITTYEHLVPITLSWKAIDDYDNVDNHKDPWTKRTKGKRIFPDAKDPDHTAIRDKLEVIVKTSPSLIGKTVYVKAFDVDDSTSEDFDKEGFGPDNLPTPTTGSPVIDINGKAGSDNLPDYIGTAKPGQLWSGSVSGGAMAQGTVDANGEAKFTFLVGMQPGNNYRVVASVIDESMYAGIQTANPVAANYLGPEPWQTGGAPASPLLTVWRKLWVESDSMEAIPTVDGYKRNDLTHNLNSPTLLTKLSDGTNTLFGIPAIPDEGSFLNLENGRIIIEHATYSVIGTAKFGNTHFVQVSGDLSTVPLGSGFRLYDDDDLGLDAAALPRQDLVTEQMKNYFKTAFVDVVDASGFNSPRLATFRLNEDMYSTSTVVTSVNETKLTDKEVLWVCPLFAAYQPLHAVDNDPNGASPESPDGDFKLGETTNYGEYDHSVVFVEGCRESFQDRFINNPALAVGYLKKWMVAVASHGMGHQPGEQTNDEDHDERGLMTAQLGGTNPMSPEGAKFLAKTTLRFRKSNRWSK